MEARRWHEQLERELRRQGLPRAYRRRLAAELTEHFHDALDDRQGYEFFSSDNSLQ